MRRLFAIDVSGGISLRMIELTIDIIHREAGSMDQAVSFDTQVRPLGLAREVNASRLVSAGGTSAQVVIDYAKGRGFTDVRFFSDGLFMENTIHTHGLDLSIDLFYSPPCESWFVRDALNYLEKCQTVPRVGNGFKTRTHFDVPVHGFPFVKKMRVNRLLYT